jgi:predicted HicB family RNase H-like nuclease
MSTSKFDPERYNLCIRRVEIEGEKMFSAKVAELPDLEEFADTFEEARALAIDSIETLAAMAEAQDVNFPAPHSYETESYSGRLTLRTSKTLHQQIADYSRRNDVSLNSAMCELLSNGLRSEFIAIASRASGVAHTSGIGGIWHFGSSPLGAKAAPVKK